MTGQNKGIGGRCRSTHLGACGWPLGRDEWRWNLLGALLTGFDDSAAGRDSEPGNYKGDISQIQDLSSVWQRQCPQFGRWAQDVDEAFAVARSNLGAIRNADQIGVAVDAESTVQLLARRDDQRLQDLTCLRAR